jgi:hypothetical protein
MSVKYTRAWTIAARKGVHDGPLTRDHIDRNIAKSVDNDVLANMTSKQIAALICAANKSYHNGLAVANQLRPGIPGWCRCKP